ncbi:aminotransferase-like domain-containing protein [Dysosmobacter sp.]
MDVQFAKRVAMMDSSVVRETLKLTARPDIISFAGGMPAPEVFPVEPLRAAADKVLRTAGRTALQYGLSDGVASLREKIAARHRAAGMPCQAEDVLMINGSQQGLDLASRLFLNPGDLVACENPTYMAALSVFRGYECDLLPIDTDEEGMVLEDLERKLAANPRVRLIYVIPTFQNPTGKTWSAARRKGLLALAERYRLPVLEDNPYGDLRYEGEDVAPLRALDTSGIVTYMGSFSKILSPGIRLGWMVAAPEVLEKLITAKQSTDVQASTFIQMMVDTYLADNDLEENIRSLRALYGKRRDLMISAMKESFPKAARWVRPRGGLFLWVSLPDGMDTTALLPRAVEEKVAYIPGRSFYAGEDVDNTLRLNYSNATEEQIVTGIRRLGRVLCSHLG